MSLNKISLSKIITLYPILIKSHVNHNFISIMGKWCGPRMLPLIYGKENIGELVSKGVFLFPFVSVVEMRALASNKCF